MLRRGLVAILVLPLLANPGLSGVHMHTGSEVAPAENHESRPHIHLQGGVKHRHHARHHHNGDAQRDRTLVASIQSTTEHDDDALYLPQSVSYTSVRKATQVTVSHATVDVTPVALLELVSTQRCTRGSSRHPPPLASATCPTYLRTLSLRI
jgi:hypothetical protein